MASQNNRRHRLMVNRPVQTRIIISATWGPFLILLITSVFVGVFCMRLAREAVALGTDLPSALWLLATVAMFMLAATGFIAFHALKLSNRIAGPMYRMARVMEAIQNGNTKERVRLRPTDLLWPLAQDMNMFLEWVEASLAGGTGEGAPDTGQAQNAAEDELVGSAGVADSTT